MENMLTVKQVADLKGCSERYIKKLALEGKLEASETLNAKNRKQYLIPISALDVKLQAKYHKQQGAIIAPKPMPTTPQADAKPFDNYTAAERDEIAFWIDIVEKWLEYRNKATTSKAEVDSNYVAMLKLENPELSISVDTLYHRLNAYKSNDMDGLTDNRGKWKKGKTTVLQPMWDTFLYYFLDEAQPSVTKCYEYMKMSIKEQFPELYDIIPHDASFRRRIDTLSKPLLILGRKGEKAYRDACGLFIRRIYDEMASNDYWIGDTHTLDVQSRGEDGAIHRLYCAAWMDARSGIFVGWNIATSSSSQNTLLALRHGISRHGIPTNVYVDNGREFLNHDIGGLGHRARKPKTGVEQQYSPPPIFKRLGITMTNAIVKNARAKTIERRFKDFKEQVSKVFATYTGGNIMERPEQLKLRVKNGQAVIDADLVSSVNAMIEFYMNYEPYGGAVKSDHGKRKIEVYNEYKHEQRNAPAAELDLMLMRSSRVQTYGRRGLHLDINGDRFDYMNEEMRQLLFGKKLYYRYDPNNLSSVRIYDLDDKFLCEALCDNVLVGEYGMSKDNVKVAQQAIRRAERTDKDALQTVRAFGRKTAFDLVLAQSMDNQKIPLRPANPKILNIHRANEEPLYKQAVGFADLDKMNKNAMKKQGGRENGQSI